MCACMSHYCTNPKCTWMDFDNSRGPSICPKCGGHVVHDFDEPYDKRDFVDYESGVDLEGEDDK